MSDEQQKLNTHISTAVLLFIFVLAGFGVGGSGSDALAATTVPWCDHDHTKAVCKNSSDIRLQISIPGLGSICKYEVFEWKNGVKQEPAVTKNLSCVSGFPSYIKGFYNLFIGIVGLLSVIMIMAGGFSWLLAAGNAQKITGAKTTIMSAIMGLVLALGSYTILSWVNPKLTELDLNVYPVNPGTSENIKGFCTKNDKLLFLKEGEIPECGQTYMFKKQNDKGEDEFCMGYMASPFEICYTDDGKTTQKIRFLNINDKRDNGFGENIWYVDTSLAGSECGFLYVKPTLPKGNFAYWVGTACDNVDKSCFIDKTKGFSFDKDAKSTMGFWETIWTGYFQKNGKKVGGFVGAGKTNCKEYK
ncbi:MAG: pilin [Candidatus Kuenenbacteria bacterium]